MTEKKIDLSKISDFEIAILIANRDIAQYAVERYDEILSEVGQAKGYADAEKQEPATEKTPLPGSENLKDLPWKSYQTKETAKENEAAWIFSNTVGAEALLATLKAKDGKFRIGVYDFQLQGDKKQFISRKPVKK